MNYMVFLKKKRVIWMVFHIINYFVGENDSGEELSMVSKCVKTCPLDHEIWNGSCIKRKGIF